MVKTKNKLFGFFQKAKACFTRTAPDHQQINWAKLDEHPGAKAIWDKIKPATTRKTIPVDEILTAPQYANIRNRAAVGHLQEVIQFNDDLFLVNITQNMKPITYLMKADGNILLDAFWGDSVAINTMLSNIPTQEAIDRRHDFINQLGQHAKQVLDIIKPEKELKIQKTHINKDQAQTVFKIYNNQDRDYYQDSNNMHFVITKINDNFFLVDLGRIYRIRDKVLSSLYSYSSLLMDAQGNILHEIKGFKARELLTWLIAKQNHASIMDNGHSGYTIGKNLPVWFKYQTSKHRTY
ncbi:MAG: hypothetical protein J6W27_02880 [Alphaproteobacteria bacterium]|nr:hypothetical protein [Alphaproteobacteria bacterium]